MHHIRSRFDDVVGIVVDDVFDDEDATRQPRPRGRTRLVDVSRNRRAASCRPPFDFDIDDARVWHRRPGGAECQRRALPRRERRTRG